MNDQVSNENNDPLEVRNKVQLDFMNVEIVDLFQRNAELLDRIISIEAKIDRMMPVVDMYTPIGGADIEDYNTLSETKIDKDEHARKVRDNIIERDHNILKALEDE